ncbi:F-box-like domain superfamily [Arabidopsis suecica]|uniref:F-box/Kelch repeat-containing F-box family protein n=2 Tax=Arabidopsis TaxID=3701 RepID=C4PVV5_ARATH|nr:F-box-like domain superfamily [Arabidopsis suecica]CAX36535.1 F-box/Kelch repeat-containing F-box family protein [Arabidopsis thaliana]CAX36567.1 F-box/Kelch repeat-containing F-box family protein [Arabidopsis thaliana]
MEKKKNNNNGGDFGEEQRSIDGDILESILSYLPLLDLDSASQVSKSWNRAVFYSLRRLKTMPWLFVYNQRNSPPYTMATMAMAYDPKSEAWIELKTASSPVEHVSVARSSHSTLLYALSPARFSFSTDAFHLTWQHVSPPRVWRIDPIVAVVGRSLIIAGGVCDFEEDRFAVELFDIESGDGAWERCESMPDFLYESASSTWLFVAVSSEKMYVTEKRSGVTCSFNPVTRSWTKLLDLCPGECSLYSRSIGFSGNRLIVAGIIGDEYNPTGIELWKVIDSDESHLKFESIGSMPETYLEKLRGINSDWPLTSIVLNAVGDMVYVHDAAENGGEIVAAEIEGGKLCKWRTLPNADATWNKSHAAERVIVACSNVGFSDLKLAFRNNLSFLSTSKY